MKSILIVEDNEDMQMIYEYMFRDHPGEYAIEIVANPLEALDKLVKAKYDLLVSDIVMESMGGERFLNALIEGGKIANMPILVVSVLKPQMLDRLRKTSRLHFLQKPVSREKLMRKIDELLRRGAQSGGVGA